MKQATPVTILSGFLGAGKTTLLNQIISQHPTTRFAIIENEFGEIGIDQDLVINVEDGIFEMSNGCICCTMNAEMAELLLKLIDRRDDYDHLVIETTGIADPSAVASVFLSEPEFQKYFKLNAIICLVDAAHINSVIHEDNEAARQISFADAIILNKKDLVQEKDLLATKKMLLEINPFAKCLDAINADVNTEELLKLEAFDPSKLEDQARHVHQHHDHKHAHITSQSYMLKGDFDLLKFRHFVQVLLILQSMRIYRIKAVLAIAGDPNKVIFQSVQQQTLFSKGANWKAGEERFSKIVVIGNNLNKTMFEKKLKSCLNKPVST